MKHNILTVSNAAEIIGIDERTVLGWCKNNVINCQDAPAEYSDKTRYLIEEDECDYIKSLISKFGARNALLNYKKGWRDTSRDSGRIEEKIPESSSPKIEEPKPEKSVVKDIYVPVKNADNSNKLVASIIYAHSLREKIDKFKEELAKLETEYGEIKETIINQL